MSGPYQPDRRQLLAAACGAAAASATAQPPAPAKKYPFKKSINQWAFPYPERMNLEACLRLAKAAGFDGIELNYDLDNDLSPKSGPAEFAQVRRLASNQHGVVTRAQLVEYLVSLLWSGIVGYATGEGPSGPGAER